MPGFFLEKLVAQHVVKKWLSRQDISLEANFASLGNEKEKNRHNQKENKHAKL